ncbi:hypothetical protein [Aeromonas veronii]|uniref:hypothetical protein n=1 Tax=Aeromonas veronii TaxID=654 RepID=UPI00191FE262|nr:hypothetical protein [Aeromonas veronii]MBL0565963.1 hypothetical protein [Aeromonas veronii]
MSIVFLVYVIDLIAKFSKNALGVAGGGAALAYDELVADEREIVGAGLHPMLPELTSG